MQNETASVRSGSVELLDEDGAVVFDESADFLPGEKIP